MTPTSSFAPKFLGCSVLLLAVACGSGANNQNSAGNNCNGGNGANTGGGACGTSGGFSIDCKPLIKVKHDGGNVNQNGLVVINTGTAPDQTLEFSVINNGNSPLTIGSVALDYTPPAPEDQPTLACYGPDKATPCAKMKWPAIQATGGNGTQSVQIFVVFAKPNDEANRQALLHIRSDDAASPPISDFVVRIKTAAGVPKMAVDSEVDLGFVKAPGTSVQTFTMKNLGTANLTVCEIDAKALDDSFTIVIDGHEYPTKDLIVLSPCIDLAPGAAKDGQVVYKGKDDNPRTADMILHTNDPSLTAEGGAGWKRVSVKVNSTGPCLKVIPTEVTFGGTAVGTVAKQLVTLKSCGDAPVKVTSLAFTDAGPGAFGIDFASIAATGGKAPTEAAPLVVDVNGAATFNVTYTPAAVAQKDAGNPILDLATVVVTAPEAPNSPINVNVSGFGSSGDCPTAVIVIAEGDAVVPQTVLNLSGAQSYSEGGMIAKYKWEVAAPPGSVSKFEPVDTQKAVKFTPNVAGEYTFKLSVTDDKGKESCAPAVKKVKVLPDQAIHVELVWHTPGDTDESNEGPNAGADMDLHFAHPYAATSLDLDKDGTPDPWYADTYDCFWYNCGSGKVLEWGSYDPNIDDNPHLDRDDTDGAGPENLNLTLPEDDKLYSVGVHYYDDHGFGPSVATVRIYVYGAEAYSQQFDLIKKDLWYVATIKWPDAAVEGVVVKGTKDKVKVPNYPAPAF